jgi:hypothetical protein
MRTIFEEHSTATHFYPKKEQAHMLAPIGSLKGRRCIKIGKSYSPIKRGQRFKMTITLTTQLLFACTIIPLFISSFRKSIDIRYKEIRTSKQKVIHYVAIPLHPERKEPPKPSIKPPPSPIQPAKKIA